jgi:predicted anti-sigma-YlaC factor YlaD
MTEHVPCDKCEELLHGYLDRALTDDEVRIAESHLDLCDYCRRRYRFEGSLRQYIKISASERIPTGLLARLEELRADAS